MKTERQPDKGQHDSMNVMSGNNSEKFLMILDSVLTPIVYVNANLQYEYINKAYMGWYELKKENIVGKYIHEILSPDVYERALPSYHAVFRGQTTYFENKTLRKGEEKYVSVRMVPHFAGDDVIGFFSTIMDITERKLAEQHKEKVIEQLRDSEQKYRRLVESLDRDYIIYSHDTEGIFTYLSPSITTCLAIPRKSSW